MTYINNKYPQSQLTSKIIGACIQVHTVLGPGYNEVIYQRALAKELQKRQLDYSREVWLDIFYEGLMVGKKRVDFIVENIILELKARSEYEPRDFFQTISYLKASKYMLALLINFGTNKVEVKRFINQITRPINR